MRQVIAKAVDEARRSKRRSTMRHGTLAMYAHRQCRCEACRAASRVYQVARAANKRGERALAAPMEPEPILPLEQRCSLTVDSLVLMERRAHYLWSLGGFSR